MRLIGYVLPVFLVAVVACSGGNDELTRGPTPNPTENMVRVDAPVESIEINKIAAKPPNATMIVVTGLRNGCEKFDKDSLKRTDDLFNLTITNLTSAGPDVACTDDYRTVTTDIPLEAPIEECKRYAVEANGERQEVFFTFTPFMESKSQVCDQ